MKIHVEYDTAEEHAMGLAARTANMFLILGGFAPLNEDLLKGMFPRQDAAEEPAQNTPAKPAPAEAVVVGDISGGTKTVRAKRKAAPKAEESAAGPAQSNVPVPLPVVPLAPGTLEDKAAAITKAAAPAVPTTDEVNKAVTRYANKHGVPATLAVVAQFGGKNVATTPPEQRANLIAALSV